MRDLATAFDVSQQAATFRLREFELLKNARQTGFHGALVDDRLRISEKHQPTIGILLMADMNDTVGCYALAGAAQPVAVSRYELTSETRKALPDEEIITRAFEDELALEASDDDDDADDGVIERQ